MYQPIADKLSSVVLPEYKGTTRVGQELLLLDQQFIFILVFKKSMS